MKNTYINIDESWGDAVEITADDYRAQAIAFVDHPSEVEERDDGIYIRGVLVAEVAE